MNKAVVIFSGGQDSTTCLIKALNEFDEVHAITFDYGQRHKKEIEVAKEIADKLNIHAHKILDVGILNELAISSLTRENIIISESIQEDGQLNTFVPGRNILFLTLASIYAYQVKATTLITGVCETDFSGYPDCRDVFVKSMREAISYGLDKNFELSTPLMWLNKAETWALADSYGQLEFVRDCTLTCYNGLIGDGCGTCPACKLRKNGLENYLENKQIIKSQLQKKTTQ